jgi:methyltransferase family protein
MFILIWMGCISSSGIDVKRMEKKLKQLFHLDNRPFVKFLRDYYGDHEINGAEIGVLYGENSLSILRLLNVNQLFLIDLFGKIDYKEGIDSGKTIDWGFCYDIAKNNLRKYNHKTNFIRKYSFDAASDIPDELDFVYIDANHDYDAVLQDIKVYYPKVKKGGVIGGHDYCPRYPGVSKAVNEFFNHPNMICDNMSNEWWIVKEN